MYTYEQLREKYPKFIYKSYEITETDREIDLTFNFEIEGLSKFSPSWKMPKKIKRDFSRDGIFRKLAFSLGMTELVSYWKITCSPEVRVACGKLTDEQTEFWKQLYFSGLGEFFYRNGIDASINDFMTIKSSGENEKLPEQPVRDDLRCLVAVGGGKDSAVSLEVLRENAENNYCFIINPRGATVKTAEISGCGGEHTISFYRTLDKNMLELNKQGFLNGHTPFSAIVAFSAVTAAYINDIKYVVLSNEASANESTVKGSDVNHQYSKSFRFEKDFHEYEKKFIGSGTYYFSLLRPMSELQIARYFAGLKQYHSAFRSCNAGSKTDSWCGKCSKCLFVSVILSPFLSMGELENIFGKNMLDDPDMETYFRQLIGLTPEKPFECVGSRDEINTAVSMAVTKMEKRGEKLPLLYEKYRSTPLFDKYKNRLDAYDSLYEKENLLPDKFRELLLKECYGERKENV